MENKFVQIRNELDSLGYTQTLLPECIPLVQKLLLDLNRTTASLQKYLRISQHALEERDLLESGVEPYKCDNAKLIRECNDLHQAFIQFKEQHEKIQRDLRHQIIALQQQVDASYSEKKKLMNHIQELEREKVRKGSKLEQSKDKHISGKTDSLKSRQEIQTSLKYKDLETKYLKLSEDNTYLKSQIKNRDEQIERLHSMVEGGRSIDAVNKDCCYKNIDSQISSLQDEVTRLKSENNSLQVQLKEAVAKQHEAMRRALHLAERNRQLEKEMKDVDEIALAVEAECNSTVRGNSEKVSRLQDRINESLIIVQKLEKENASLEKVKLELSADLEALKLERNHLKRQFEKEQESNKKLTDRINSLTIIENDLNLEIDRLTKLSAEQKRKIVELESGHGHSGEEDSDILHTAKATTNTAKNDMSHKGRGTIGSLHTKSKVGHKKSGKKSAAGKSSPSKSPSPVRGKHTQGVLQKCCCESGNCFKNLRDLLDKEVELRHVNTKQSLEDLRNEKEYYMKEYHRVVEQLRNVPNREVPENGLTQLSQLIKEKDNQIKKLEDDVKRLQSERSPFYLGGASGANGHQTPCEKPNCKNRERELEVKSKELSHLELENSTLKAKLQAVNENTTFNEERVKKAFKDMEEHIRKLEDERRNLVKAEVTQRSNISHLEDDYRTVKEQLKQTQVELNNVRANYNQLKLLHEQTDRALSEAQSQAIHSETELVNYKAKVRDSSRNTGLQDKEIAKLTADIHIMKNQLTKLDKEKDELLNNLDDKTEKIAALEEDVGQKNKVIAKLEGELKELNRKLSKHSNESNSHDKQLRSKQQEYLLLEQEYEKEKRLKEAALIENKRLQNDLSSITYDCREARNELEISKRQVEDLKRQLQHYVAEVKRTEDLISQKELERSELLDQFKSLSQEAGILENNNHTLESEATNSKIQLCVALDHTTELERQLQHQESVIKSYEKQIAELSENVAKLEVKLREHVMEHEHCKAELKQMRDLCVKLDAEKDSLKSELHNKDDRRTQVQEICKKLSSEKDLLEKQVELEKNSLEAVEKLLNDARSDLTEQRLLNQDLQREVARLKQKISELEERLTTTAEQLDIYQGKALEYSQINKQLRRDIANERFSRSKSDEKGYFPSL